MARTWYDTVAMLRILSTLAVVAIVALAWFALRGSRATDGGVTRQTTVTVPRGAADDVTLSSSESASGRVECIPPVEIDDRGSTQADPAEANGFVIRVETPTGEPLANGPITVTWCKGWSRDGEDSGVTDDDGMFSTTVTRLFEFEDIEVEHADFPSGLYIPEPEFFADPLDPDLVRVRVPARQRLIVRVVDHAGRPQVAATVMLERHITLGRDPFVHTLVSSWEPEPPSTDLDGRTEIDLELGIWALDVMGRQGVPFDKRVTLDEAGGTREVLLRVISWEDGRLVHVDVQRDDHSKPLSVMARGQLDRPGMARSVHSSATSEEGDSFEIPVPSIGTWTIIAYCHGYETVRVPVIATTRSLTITLVPSGEDPASKRLIGRVVSALDGTALSATITTPTYVSSTSQSSGPMTGADGSFDLEWPPNDSFYVRADSDGRATSWLGPISSSDDGPFVLRLCQARRIAGRVQDRTGRPVEARVRIYHRGEQVVPVDIAPHGSALDSHWTSVDTGPAGEFHIEGVTAGTQMLWVMPTDLSLPPALLDVVGGDEAVVVILGDGLAGRGTLRGRVVDSLTGRPIPHVEVDLLNGTGAGTSGRTDSEGRYVVYGVVPGRFDAFIEPEPESGFEYAYRSIPSIEVLAGENVLDVELVPARRLHLFVRNRDGQPAAHAQVSALDEDGGAVVFLDRYGNDDDLVVELDAGGRASLHGVPAGVVTLRVWKNSTAEQPGDALATTLEVDLNEPRVGIVEVTLEH